MLFETSMLTSGFSLPEPTAFAQRIHKLIKLGLCIYDAGPADQPEEKAGSTTSAAAAGADTMPPLEDAEAAATTMEEVD